MIYFLFLNNNYIVNQLFLDNMFYHSINNKDDLIKILNEFQQSYVRLYNFEVVFVNKLNLELKDKIFQEFSFKIISVENKKSSKSDTNHNWLNDCIKKLNNEIIIIQNVNYYHNNDIFKKNITNLDSKNCIIFKNQDRISSISLQKNNLELISNIDMRFKIEEYQIKHIMICIKYNLKLKIQIIESEFSSNNIDIKDSNYKKENEICNNIINIHERNDFIYPKLLFLYWDGSPLSYLNYLTVESFNNYNPEWKKYYTPEKNR